jgi:pyruvate/2-oxoglutarate dehydrogenase complex dihydrolipoamide acyltransferase (E2) component
MAKVINGYQLKWGDRRDGRWVKTPGLQTIMAHLFPNRTDREVYLHDTLDITELAEFVKKKNEEHPDLKTTFFHCVIAATAKMVRERPLMNRFIQGRRTYERFEISVAFVAKREFSEGAEEALLFFVPKDTDTVDDVSRMVVDKVKKVRDAGDNKGGIDDLLDKFAAIPRPILMMVIKIIRWLDFWGKTPKSLTEGDPNFSTVFLSNLGSIKCPSVYHHLNNYGTNSMMITIGTMRDEEKIMPDGTKQVRKLVDFGATLDESIGDGFYFARSLKLIHYICAHPELLDRPIGEPSGFDYK